MRTSTSHIRPANFYSRSFARAQSAVNHVTNLTDAVTLLTQATESLIHGQFLGTFSPVSKSNAIPNYDLVVHDASLTR